MTEDEATRELDALANSDPESAHDRADAILLAVLDGVAPRIVGAWREARDRVGFWYA